MTNRENEAPEAPITWIRKKVWGAVGMTHYGNVTINGEAWKFTVDQPSSGYWTARGWRDGEFALYREGRTMSAMKAEAEAYANYAATQTCGECLFIGGHTLTCTVTEAATRVGTELAKIAPALAELGPVVNEAAASMSRAAALVKAARDRVQFRKDTCGCPTPLHTMRCGVGGRVLVRKAAV